MKAVLEGVGGEILESGNLTAAAVVRADGKTRFPLKDKDTCQSCSVTWLKLQGLFPQAEVRQPSVPLPLTLHVLSLHCPLAVLPVALT